MRFRWTSRTRSIAWVTLGTAGLYTYVYLTGDPDLPGIARLAFGFELLCWAGALVLLILLNPSRVLRISDPGLLLVLWSTIYLVLPSVFWMKGAAIAWSRYITTNLGVELLWLHGIFILSLAGGYLVARPPRGIPVTIDAGCLPSGWGLFLLPVVPLAVEVILRVAAGGGVFPESTYGEVWTDMQTTIQASRDAGGLSYLWTQVWTKIVHYPVLAQGVGLGLIASEVWTTKRRRISTILFAGVVIVTMLMFGSGVRSGFIIVFLIALILADLLAGPIPLRYFGAAVVVGLLVFEFLGAFRAYRNLPVQAAFSESIEAFLASDYPLLGEFTGMLSKEALVVQHFRDAGRVDGLGYLLLQVLSVVPSQLVPSKLAMEGTGALAAREILGEAFYAGGGVAGTMIGEGYRVSGMLGIPLLAFLVGAMYGGVQRWLMGSTLLARTTSLLRLGLWAGFLGWAFMIIRNDLGSIFVSLLYDCAVPLLLVSIALSGRMRDTWVSSVSRFA